MDRLLDQWDALHPSEVRRGAVDRACRLWLGLDGAPPGVASRLDGWRRRHAELDSVWYASIVARLLDGDPAGAGRLLASWPVPGTTPTGGARWWADRLVGAVERGAQDRPAPALRSWPGVAPGPGGTWVHDVVGSLRTTAAESTAQVIVLHTGTERALLASALGSRLADIGLRPLACPLDDPDARHPLAGWLAVLWSDVHWRFLGDARLARLAAVIDHHLGWPRPAEPVRRVDDRTLDGRRSDAVVVELALRLTATSPDPLVVVVTGGPAALTWFSHLAHLAQQRRPASGALRFVDVHLPVPDDRRHGDQEPR